MLKSLIVEGGALRGVFSTGLLDGFLERRFNPFDFYIGVSSGASNIAAYLAEMPGRNAKIYLDYSLRPEFINYPRFLRGGHLLDLDWLWDITIREIRLDLQAIYSRRKIFIAVMTDVQTGRVCYKATGPHDLEQTLKASSAMPLVFRGYPEVDGRAYTDGGLSDPLPVNAAIEMGAGKIMVVRSRTRTYLKRRSIFDEILKHHLRDYPLLREAVDLRIERYNESVRLIRKPPPGVEIIEVCPPDDFRASRLSRDRAVLEEGYGLGRSAALRAMENWG